MRKSPATPEPMRRERGAAEAAAAAEEEEEEEEEEVEEEEDSPVSSMDSLSTTGAAATGALLLLLLAAAEALGARAGTRTALLRGFLGSGAAAGAGAGAAAMSMEAPLAALPSDLVVSARPAALLGAAARKTPRGTGTRPYFEVLGALELGCGVARQA